MKFEPHAFVNFTMNNHRRLAHIMRYNTTPISIKESVAEHSYFVAFYAMLLCSYLKQNGIERDVDELRVLKRALVHDMEEIISGDIITTFKYQDPKFLELLGTLNSASIDKMLMELPTLTMIQMKNDWENSKDDSIEGLIVTVADKLSLLTYCIEQIKIGNSYMEPIYMRSVLKLEKLNKPWINDLLKEFWEHKIND